VTGGNVVIVPLLAAALLQSDTVSASPALRELVARAAEGNREAPAELLAYQALVESEAALVLRTGEGEELVGQIEQIASRVRWQRDGSFTHHVIGHRVQATSPNVSVLTSVRRGWLVPILYGEELRIIPPPDSADGQARRRPVYRAVHPVSALRDSVYRFDGGDTVAVLALPERTLHVVRIRVTPRSAPPGRVLLFHGDIDLDADRYQIVRMRGRLVAYGAAPGPGARLVGLAVRGIAYLEVECSEHEGRYWLPYRQRLEFHALTPLTEGRAILRIASRFRDHRIEKGDATAAPAHRPSYRLTLASGDTLTRFDDWSQEPGEATAGLSARDFDDVAPAALRPHGPPLVRFGVRRFTDLVRYDRVEGLYTGAGATLALRDAAPGLELRVHGGWAWSEATPRGAVELSYRRAPWTFSLGAGRELAHTNDFVSSFERQGGFPPLLLLGGIDDFDYLDRRGAIATVARDLDPAGETRMALELGRLDDRPEVRRLLRGPLTDDTLRWNRPISPGRYTLARLVLERGRSIGLYSLRPGIGARLVLERAWGGLEWRRVEGTVQLRGARGPFTFASRLDAGVVLGDPPPLQTLYELGTASGLPGFEYKEFAGDRAALLRAGIRYHPGIFAQPIRIGALVLPGIAPAPAVQWQAGWTRASDDAVAAAVGALDSRETGGVRAAVDLRLTLFGGFLGVGLARPVDRHGDWDVVWSVGAAL